MGRRLFDDQSPHLDRFGPLLGLTVLTITVMSLIDLGAGNETDAAWPPVASSVVSLVIGITLLVALRASGVARRWLRLIDGFMVIAVLLSVVTLVVDLSTDADLSGFEADRPSPIWVFIALITPLSVIRRLVRHRRVGAATMFGAIAAYLLFAVAFTYLFLYVDGVQDQAFFGDVDDPPTTSFMYFSLVSVTTLGYGDLAPATELGRLMATAEAVIGQVYLVTFVAMLVGLFIQQRDPAP